MAQVRIVQALIDTATCALIALLAFHWQPDEKKKRATALAALTLADRLSIHNDLHRHDPHRSAARIFCWLRCCWRRRWLSEN
jgi:hypothetical protein